MNLVIRNGPSTYVIEKTSFVKIKVDTRVARELRLLGVTQHELRGQKLAEILIFYVGQKIIWRIFAPIGLKLLNVNTIDSYECMGGVDKTKELIPSYV